MGGEADTGEWDRHWCRRLRSIYEIKHVSSQFSF
jgi:hypothetical protein